MSDEVLRRLERTAATGDSQAQAGLRRELERVVTQDIFDRRNEELTQKLEDLLIVLGERTSEEVAGARRERVVARRVEEIRRANGLQPAARFRIQALIRDKVLTIPQARTMEDLGVRAGPMITGRQSGRTTEMLLRAAAVASLGRTVAVVARTADYAKELEEKGRDLLNWANLRGGDKLRAMSIAEFTRAASPRRESMANTVDVLVDHHAGDGW